MDEATRTCSRCHLAKPFGEFPIKDRTKGTYRSYCRLCCREYGREHYRKNAAYYKRTTRVRSAIDRPRNRAFVAEYLATHRCLDCGASDPLILEFDHRDPTSKLDDVGHLIHSGPLATLAAEITKCDVRCGNCHRRRTLLQFGSYRVWMGNDA